MGAWVGNIRTAVLMHMVRGWVGGSVGGWVGVGTTPVPLA